jgi:hypothetical protein
MMFDGGQNNKFERSIIAENETPSCANVIFSNGGVETRGGTTRLNTTAIGSFAGDGLYTRNDNTGAQTMIAFAGGSAWQLNVTTFSTIASAQSVFTAGVRVGTTQYENHMFIGNGGVTPYKYNGTAFTRHGVPAPTTTMSVVSNGAGNLAGDYRYKVVFVNSAAAFGDVSPATTTFAVTATGGQTRVSSIPVAPQSHGVSSRRLYRTDAGGSSYKFIATISDNSTTTYDDNIASSAAGVVAPTDNGEPPKYNVACYHQNRLFVNDTANPNYVWYSELFEPYTFGATNFLPIGDASRDLVKGLEVYNNAILVTCENSVHLVYMPSTDDAEWSVIRLLTPFGSRSPYGIFLYENRAMIPAMQSGKFIGFGAVSGNSVDPGATLLTTGAAGSELQSDRVEPDMFQIQEAYVGNISAMVFKNKAYISVTHGDGNVTNNRIWVFDFSKSNLAKNKTQKAAWSPITGLGAAQFTVYNGALYFIEAAATGFVNQLESTTPTDGSSTAIDSYFWTKEIAGNPGDENFQKDFRNVKLLVEKTGNYYMNVAIRVDSDGGEGNVHQVDLSSDADVWGVKAWGQMIWGAGSDQEEVTIHLGQVSGKRIQMKFSNQNTAGQRFKVIGGNVTYNIKGRR